MEKKIVELRNAGYTWNQIDEMLLPPEQITKKNGKIVSKCFKIAKKLGLSEAFSKAVIGAYTATQIVIPNLEFKGRKVFEKREETAQLSSKELDALNV